MMAARVTSIIVMVIVAATIIAGLIAGAQRDDSGPIDLIILNGKVYTADGSGRFAEAVAVRGNQIVRIGTNRDIKRLRRPQTQVIDAHSGAVLPGFNDAHAQLLKRTAAGEVSLFQATTLEQIQETIRAAAAAEPERGWIVGRGWSASAFPGGMPTRQQLDAVVSDRPAYFISRDGHTGWANSKALALAGINWRTPSPLHGVIVTDPRTGVPTGVLNEDARQLVERLLTSSSREDRLHALRDTLAEAGRHGVTSIQTTGDEPADIDLYDELRRAGQLTARVYGVVAAPERLTESQLEALDRVFKQYPDDPLLKAGAVSVALDGSVESHTALMLEPYANRKGTGLARYTAEELRRTIAALDRRGWQIVVEAAGDGALKLALDAYSQILVGHSPGPSEHRHRLAGIETIDPADLSRLGQLHLIAQQAPMRAILMGQESRVWSLNLGPDRASRGWMWQSIAAAGGPIIFGSDSPAAPLDPMIDLYAATNRTSPDVPDAEPWMPDQKMPLPRAIDAYTRTPAFASFDEQRKGVLAPGMLADLVILSTDIFALPPERLLDGQVDVTIFDGKVIFQRQAAPRGTH
jgi:predicted amidohydrolase YtcJ